MPTEGSGKARPVGSRLLPVIVQLAQCCGTPGLPGTFVAQALRALARAVSAGDRVVLTAHSVELLLTAGTAVLGARSPTQTLDAALFDAVYRLLRAALKHRSKEALKCIPVVLSLSRSLFVNLLVHCKLTVAAVAPLPSLAADDVVIAENMARAFTSVAEVRCYESCCS